MKIVNTKYLLSSAVLATSALGFVLPAHAFDFKVSGQVDRAITAANNGEESDVGFVDNSGSNTRFRFTGSQEMNNGVTLGFQYEVGLGENSSGSFDINNGGGSNADFYDNRQANVFVKGGFGKFTLGKHDGAANGTSEVNYSGTEFLGGGVDSADYAGGISFLDDDGNVLGTVGSATSSFDALSRQNSIRYDTPSIGGATFSASLDSGHAYELAARYELEFGDGGKFGFAGDWVDSENNNCNYDPGNPGNTCRHNPAGDVIGTGNRFQEYGGSASVLLPVGLNFSGTYKRRKFLVPDRDATTYFGSVGYIVGANHFELSYLRTDDALNEDSKGNAYGAAYEYDWTDTVELYASYHLFQLDNALNGAGSKVDAQNINQIYLGTRIKFL